MVLTKHYLRFQDYFGLYSYPAHYRLYEHKPGVDPVDAPEIFFSIVVRAAGSKPDLLNGSCEALIHQSHRHWEARLILDDSLTINDLPEAYQQDSRIRAINNPPHPTWKDALRACTGDWIVYLNCGDVLATDALATISQQIKEHPKTSIIYTDVDRLSMFGNRHYSPSFWPDWSPELLLSVNYLRPAYILRSELLKAAEKTEDFEDALLRCAESAAQVVHVSQVLCHTRYIQEDPWMEAAFKPGNIAAHLRRLGLQEASWQSATGATSPHYVWSFNNPSISIIILTHDNADLLRSCIESILKYTQYPDYEIILVENNSREKATFDFYKQLENTPQVKVLAHNLPFNYSAFNNWGVEQSRGEVLLFLNNDIQCFEPGWLDEMARWACRPEVGVVGAKLLYRSGAIQHAGLVIGLEGHANHIFAGKMEGYDGLFGSDEWYRDYSAVTGACLMMRRSVFDQVGGFDEHYILAFNDVELCLRAIQAGYRVVYTPFARLFHNEGATRSKFKPASDIRLAYRHLKPWIERGDPYYNPNLSTMLRVPTLRRPGEITATRYLDQILEYQG